MRLTLTRGACSSGPVSGKSAGPLDVLSWTVTHVHRAARRTLQIRPIMRQQQKVIDDVDARHAHSTGSNLLDSVVQIRELTGTTDESNDRAIMEALRGAGWRVEGALETLFAQQDVRSAEANLGDRRTRQQQQLLFSSVTSQSLLLCKEKRGQGMKLNMGRHQWAQILKHKCPLTPSHMLYAYGPDLAAELVGHLEEGEMIECGSTELSSSLLSLSFH